MEFFTFLILLVVSPGNRLIDIFPSHFYFHLSDKKNKESKRAYICKLNKLIPQVSDESKTDIVVSDMSIKNQVAMLITYIHVYDNYIIKTLYHMINVTSTEVELFTIRYNINQTTEVVNINHIITITDLIHVAKRIFNLLIHLYQAQSLLISKELGEFFNRDQHNFIKF